MLNFRFVGTEHTEETTGTETGAVSFVCKVNKSNIGLIL